MLTPVASYAVNENQIQEWKKQECLFWKISVITNLWLRISHGFSLSLWISHFNKGLTCYSSMGPNSCSSGWIERPVRDVTFSGYESLLYYFSEEQLGWKKMPGFTFPADCFCQLYFWEQQWRENSSVPCCHPLIPLVLLEGWTVVVDVQCTWKLCTSSQWLLPYQIGCTSLLSLRDCCILPGF